LNPASWVPITELEPAVISLRERWFCVGSCCADDNSDIPWWFCFHLCFCFGWERLEWQMFCCIADQYPVTSSR
jgi:hypothetical protein